MSAHSHNGLPYQIYVVDSKPVDNKTMNCLSRLPENLSVTLCIPRARGEARQQIKQGIAIRRYDSLPFLQSASTKANANSRKPKGLRHFIQDRLKRFPIDLIHVIDRQGEADICRRELHKTNHNAKVLVDYRTAEQPWLNITVNNPLKGSLSQKLLFSNTLLPEYGPMCAIKILATLHKYSAEWHLQFLADGPMRRQLSQAALTQNLASNICFAEQTQQCSWHITPTLPSADSTAAQRLLQLQADGHSLLLPGQAAWLLESPRQHIQPKNTDYLTFCLDTIQNAANNKSDTPIQKPSKYDVGSIAPLLARRYLQELS